MTNDVWKVESDTEVETPTQQQWTGERFLGPTENTYLRHIP
jgi:hypothetical protein